MMEILVGKRLESQSFNQHLEQLLKHDDNLNRNDPKDNDDKTDNRKMLAEKKSFNEETRVNNNNEEPCDLRTQTSQSKEASCSSPDTETFHDAIHSDGRRSLCKSEPDEESGSCCSACDLLNSLDYLRRHRMLCDVMFRVQSKTYYAHRAVMASCSEMYREKYLEEIRNNNQKQIDELEIDNVSRNVFEKVLDFVYTGKIEINDEETAQLLMDAAHVMKIKSLIHKCRQYIKSNDVFENSTRLIANVSPEKASDGMCQSKHLQHHSGEDLQNDIQKHEYIVPRNQPLLMEACTQSEPKQRALPVPAFFESMALQREGHRSRVSLNSNPCTSRLIEEKKSFQSKDQNGMSNFNPWSNFFRNRMLSKDYNLLFRYGYAPFFNNILPNPGQNSTGKKLSSPFTAPFLRYSPSQTDDAFKTRSFSNSSFVRNFTFDEHKKNVLEVLNRTRSNSATLAQDQQNYVLENHSAARTRGVSTTSEKETLQLLNLSEKRHKTDDASKPYNCPLCDAHFNRPANLKTHMRIHSGEKPYKCDTCGARFVQVAHLRAHVLIHTGEKPYPCNVCGTSFRHLQTLKSHLRIHTGEKPYSCEKCRVQFRHKSQLRLHLRTKHGVQTNTKKTYKQVPGLRSADISAHIKRAQEAAKSNFSVKTNASPGFSQIVDSVSSPHGVEASMVLSAPHSSSNNDISNFVLNGGNDSSHSYKLNVQAHFTKLDDVEDLTKNDDTSIDSNVAIGE